MRGTALAVIVIAFITAVFPPAAAQVADDGARVEPVFAEPGFELELIFSVTSPDLLEAVVQERISCVVVAPDGGEEEVCERAGPAVEARLVGSGTREYVFPHVASALLGAYTVRFQTASTLRLLGSETTAEAQFFVVPTGTLPEGADGDPTPNGVPGADGEDGAAGSDGDDGDTGSDGAGGGGGSGEGDDGVLPGFDLMSGDRDAARILVSSTVGLGVLALAFVGNRWPFGGGKA
jgi:hypothetical protein